MSMDVYERQICTPSKSLLFSYLIFTFFSDIYIAGHAVYYVP